MGAMLLREGHRGHGPLLRVNPGLCSWPTPYCIRPGAKTDSVKGVPFSTLEAICRELDCQPGDLLQYRGDD